MDSRVATSAATAHGDLQLRPERSRSQHGFWWLVGLLDTRPDHGQTRISFENGFREFKTPVFSGIIDHSRLCYRSASVSRMREEMYPKRNAVLEMREDPWSSR